MIAVSLGASKLVGGALAQSEADEASVASTGMTQSDTALVLVMETMQPLPGETEQEFRIRAERILSAQTFAERLVASSFPEVLPEIEARAARVRASLALDYVLSRRVEVTEPSEADIDAFIAENPRLFAGRASFRYATYVIAPETDVHRAQVEELIAALEARPSLTASDLQTFTRAMQEAEVPAVGRSATSTSEQIDPRILDALEEIAEAGRMLQWTANEDQSELLVLLQRTPDPVDPAVMRQQVAMGLMRTELERQRAQIIESLASSSRRLAIDGSGELPASSGRVHVSGPDIASGAQRPEDLEAARAELELERSRIMSNPQGSSRGLVVAGPDDALAGEPAPDIAAGAQGETQDAPAVSAEVPISGPYFAIATLLFAGLATPMAFSVSFRWARRRPAARATNRILDDDYAQATGAPLIGKAWMRVMIASLFSLLCVVGNGALGFMQFPQADQLTAAGAAAGGLALGVILALLGSRVFSRGPRAAVFWTLQAAVLISVAGSDTDLARAVLG